MENTLERIGDGVLDYSCLTGKLNRILEQVQRAAAVINQMHIFGREDQSPRERVDPRRVVRNVLDLVCTRLALRRIEVDLSLADRTGYRAGAVHQLRDH